jgi:signal transduction histidine kinase
VKELEITEIPPLSTSERSLVDMHSVLNVFNVLRGELTLIGLTLAGKEDLLKQSLKTCDRMIRDLSEPGAALEAARKVDLHARSITAEIEAQLDAQPGLRSHPEITESLANLASVFSILQVRARELLARLQVPDLWVEHSVTALRQSFLDIFSAIEKNSHGRYRLIYNVALVQPPDYYVDFKIDSVGGEKLWMPPVFQDVMRDLIANGRKYTAPGGRIIAALHAGADQLMFHIEDTGRGIPADELAKVVEFGRRASNVGDVRTMGGGFGLTKAFLVTKQFGGRFWIASEVGVGTRIRIQSPRTTAIAPVAAGGP